MKNLILKFISWVGIDRFAHFGLAGFVCASAALFGWIPYVVAFVVVQIAGIVKEKCLDAAPDWMDFVAALVGSVVSGALFVASLFV